jgi:hypothetical protein
LILSEGIKTGGNVSAIHGLIAQISDPHVRERLAAEWASTRFAGNNIRWKKRYENSL